MTRDATETGNETSRRRRKLTQFALFMLVAALAYSGAVMLLWNWLMPTLFELPEIHFGQALGLLILTRILFGGFRGRFGPVGRRRIPRDKEAPSG